MTENQRMTGTGEQPEDWSSCTESMRAAVKSISSFNLFPVQGGSMTGIMGIPTLVDSVFLNRSNCDALMHKNIYNIFFRQCGVNMNYETVNIRGATGNAVPVIGTFWARLTVNGDNDYLHEVTDKVFSVGVVTGCPRPLVVGTSVMQSLGIGIYPGNPGYLSFVDRNNLGVNRGWGAQVKVEQLTPVPATDEGWKVMDQGVDYDTK